MNLIRHNISTIIVRWKHKLGIRNKNPLKLHLGCGGQHLEGYVNINWRKTTATDLICDIKKLPYPDNSVKLIETYHAIEHLPRHDFPKALKEWYRVLRHGGKLIIECPDFDEIVKKYLNGDEKQLDGIFGLQRFKGDYHVFGYSLNRLTRLLKECDFTDIKKKEPQDYHAKVEGWSNIRVEGTKDYINILEFTGERVVEGNTPTRIWLDHVERYKCACRYVNEKIVLDISCGTGYGSKILREAGAIKIVGIDVSEEAVDFARNKYRMDGLEFRVGNILDIDSLENYFDVITCFETIEHIENQKKTFTELRKVLKSEGLLIISSPNRKLTSPSKFISDHPNNPYHTKEYSTEEFVSILKNYFEVLEVYGQRGLPKVSLLPFVKRILLKPLPWLYGPKRGKSQLEKILPSKEYRYITVICQKSNKKI